MQNEFGIYKWTNLVTGRVLVGQTGSSQGFHRRKLNYLSCLRRGKYRNSHFQASFNKYGESEFSMDVIEIHTNNDNLTERENFWIDFYRSLQAGGYNASGPAECPTRGTVPSAETREKLSRAKKGKKLGPQSPELIAKRTAHRIGRPMPQETKDKIGAKAKGRKASKETKEKLSKAAKGRPTSEAQKKAAAESCRSRVITDEMRVKMSASAKLREAKKKERRALEEAEKLSSAA